MASNVRLAKETDWLGVLTLLDQVYPDSKEANRAWWRERQRFDGHTFRRRHYVIEAPVPGPAVLAAYAGVEEGPEPKQFRLFLVMEPALLNDLGQKLFAGLMSDLAGLGATVVTAREGLYSPMRDFLRSKGFQDELRVPVESGGEAVVMVKALG